MNSDLNKQAQAQALEVTFSRKTKSCHSQTCFNIYINNTLHSSDVLHQPASHPIFSYWVG